MPAINVEQFFSQQSGTSMQIFNALGLILTNCCALVMGTIVLQFVSSEARAQQLPPRHAKARQELFEKFHISVREQIRFCESNQLEQSVTFLKSWLEPINGELLVGVNLPTNLQDAIPLGLPPLERKWQVEFRQQRQDTAHRLYLLSRRMLNDGYATAAWNTLREVVHFDPDHKQARLILGFETYDGQWVTPYAAKMLKNGNVWTQKFGWLKKEHVARYENGERYFGRRWISAEREKAIRQSFKNAWEVETDHYVVRTNTSLEQGLELATALEEFQKYFRRTFAAFFNSPEQLKQMFDGRKRRTRSSRYEIHFFRTRQEYINKLQKNNPRIAITNGIYMPDDKVAYFFKNDDPDTDTLGTLYHEATHQILYEAFPTRRAIAEREHFWIIEGIACYMESFKKLDQGYEIGDTKYVRFRAADYRLNAEDYYVPLNRFAAMGKNAFQSAQEISKNYSQASGLAHFFMHYDGGKYRDALIKHLLLLYTPRTSRVRVAGLDQLTKVPSAKLDQQYKQYMIGIYGE